MGSKSGFFIELKATSSCLRDLTAQRTSQRTEARALFPRRWLSSSLGSLPVVPFFQFRYLIPIPYIRFRTLFVNNSALQSAAKRKTSSARLYGRVANEFAAISRA